MRLRTLPLSLGGVLCGALVACFFVGAANNASKCLIIEIALTACALQVLSNLSNELGDYRNGVDSVSDRQGPAYGMLEGGLSERQMVLAIRITAVCCCLFDLVMTWHSFGTLLDWRAIALLMLGAAAVWAATHYTLGKNPYGYRGLGDFVVFIFFGLVSVLGSFYVVAHTLVVKPQLVILLPAVGMGLLSVAVLNVNNIRDIETDRGTRTTTPIRIGEKAAKWYQTALVLIGVGCFFYLPMRPYPMLVTLPFYVWHLVIVWRGHGRRLDPALPLLVLSTFVLAVIYAFTSAFSTLR